MRYEGKGRVPWETKRTKEEQVRKTPVSAARRAGVCPAGSRRSLKWPEWSIMPVHSVDKCEQYSTRINTYWTISATRASHTSPGLTRHLSTRRTSEQEEPHQRLCHTSSVTSPARQLPSLPPHTGPRPSLQWTPSPKASPSPSPYKTPHVRERGMGAEISSGPQRARYQTAHHIAPTASCCMPGAIGSWHTRRTPREHLARPAQRP